MTFKEPELIENRDGTLRVQCTVETREGKRLLWYDLDARYKEFLTLDRLDAFVAGLILYAMKINDEIVVEGPISSKLARNLKYYMHVMRMFYPSLHVVPLHTPHTDPLRHCARGTAVGSSFTTGIDSYCTLWNKFKNEEIETNRITHLFYVYAGQGGWRELDGRTLYQKNLEIVKEAANRLNLELVVVESNLDHFYGFGDFINTLGPRIFSCVLLLQKLFSIFHIPSTYTYSNPKAQGSTPLGDHLLSTEVLDIVHDGAQYRRLEKTKIISQWEITHSIFSVCNQNSLDGKMNCSSCEKCLRTMITLDMMGSRKQYEQVLDFTDFEKKRDLYVCYKKLFEWIGEDLGMTSWGEIKKYAKETGYPLRIKPGRLLLAMWLIISHNPSRKINKLLKNWRGV